MSNSTKINSERISALRKRAGISQKELAAKVQVDTGTVSRWERGEVIRVRVGVFGRLCSVLHASQADLCGEGPLPMDRPPQPEPQKGQMNISIDAACRNALSLTALRYKVPISRIVELSAFLFVVAAERSLERRDKNLSDLLAAYDSVENQQGNFSHLPRSVASNGGDYAVIMAEQKSIDQRDIFARSIPDEIFSGEEYDESEDNPFVVCLKELTAEASGAAKMNYFGARTLTSYEVCRDDALAMAGGDEELANGILSGWALIHEMPRELLKPEASAERVAWLRPRIDAARKEHEEAFKELDQMWTGLTADQQQKLMEQIESKTVRPDGGVS